MDASQFVSCWKAEKDSYLASLRNGGLLASEQIVNLDLSGSQSEELHDLLDTVLTGVMYTLLLSLDGAAQIGGMQHSFEIRDEDGNVISPSGELESEAFKQFQTS